MSKEHYCILDGYKRLRDKGHSPSEALEISREVYKEVKKKWDIHHK